MFQALESRTLLSATVDDGELLVEATSSADEIIVGVEDGAYFVEINGDHKSFPEWNVDRIIVRGLGGSDLIDASEIPIPLVLNGGPGNDTLLGGTADDRLAGGSGDDSLDGGEGGDHLKGDAGRDTLQGSDGNDTLLGSAGNDRLFGGENCDYLNGGIGNDRLEAGRTPQTPGSLMPETLLGGDGHDTLHGHNNSLGDFLDGGTGRDFAYYEFPRAGSIQDLLYNVERGVGYRL